MTRLDEIRERWDRCEMHDPEIPYLLALADALARLVETEPVCIDDSFGYSTCIHCNADTYRKADRRIKHAPDCPWRMARELVEG